MALKLKPLQDQVIVITGASSGIGLATARAAAKAGARLVLAARGEEALASIARELSPEGTRVAYVGADVGRRTDVQRIADTARERFGGFDTWVNDAGVSIFGHLQEVTEEDSRRLFDTNFWGVVNGSLVAVNHLKERGGALINLGSVVSDYALPVQGMYSSSKHAVKGFTDALRAELEHEGAPVWVTLIKPTSIDTPFPEHAKNYMPNEPTLPAPVYRPEEVARAILFAATHPTKRDIYVGSGGRAMSTMSRVLPRAMDRVGAHVMHDQQLRDEPARHRSGALHEPGRGGRVRGNHPGYVMRTSLYSRASRHPMMSGLVAATAGAAAYALITRSGDRHPRDLALD